MELDRDGGQRKDLTLRTDGRTDGRIGWFLLPPLFSFRSDLGLLLWIGLDWIWFWDDLLHWVERSHGNKRRDAPRGSYSGQHSKYRVKVSGLPTSCSWQDLKDFCRDAGSVLFTDVSRDGTGVVEFEKEDDMLWALKNLDGIKLKTHTGDESYVRFVEESGARSRSPSPRRERSRSPPPRDSPPRGTPPPPQE